MTAQISDQVRYRGRLYAITAVEGHGLFDLAEHGIEPQMLSTACWRGTWCRYAVRRGHLKLVTLQLARSSTPKTSIFGVKPHTSPPQDIHDGAWLYHLDAAIAFSGRLLVGADFHPVGYLNMGFMPAWLYERVHELHFVRGRLISTHNRSVALAGVRHRIGPEGLGPAVGEASGDWIDRTFSLTFDYSWPTSAPAGHDEAAGGPAS